MDDGEQVPVSAQDLLTSFFATAPVAAHPAIRARVPRVRAHLLTYLDTEAEDCLTNDELTLLHAERQLQPRDAVLRVVGAEALLVALPGFCHPAWLLPALADAHAQLRVVAALRDRLAEEPLGTDAVCLLRDVDAAVRRAQAVLDGSPAA
ncbi:hypothetical protein FE251_10845 [Georgenia wutianyii]|uniref:Uncharacterized protein n=1 Tax=Georgenia wutianyii TaxID=2585135 RepID=A0ABX5VNN9_9MICO|nr:hypothetical protein [Georgenia wutianyii]QDB79818.1 hypothetical protein FE251_10845 [Georgenia wutianyii]